MFYDILSYPDSRDTDLRVEGSDGDQRPRRAGQEGQQRLPQAGSVPGRRDQEYHVQTAPDTHCTRTEGVAEGADPWRETGRMSKHDDDIYCLWHLCHI